MKNVSLSFFLTVLCFITFTGSGFASVIVINPGAGLSANTAALASFRSAAQEWGSIFSDPITVTIDADLASLGAGILGSTSSVMLRQNYNAMRNEMTADAANESSNGIVASLPTAAQISVSVPTGFSVAGTMLATKANLKAMGVTGLDAQFGASDATIQFSSNFNFDYDSSNGVTAGTYDFKSVAAHEIGHALGFVSGVDGVDSYLHAAQTAAVELYPLDLFRFATVPTPATFSTATRSLLTGGSSYFYDGTNQWAFSTGLYTGDGRQASHWKDDSLTGTHIGLMDPTLSPGVSWGISTADIRALDLIGWDVAAVPEPSTYILLSLALGVVGIIRKTLSQ